MSISYTKPVFRFSNKCCQLSDVLGKAEAHIEAKSRPCRVAPDAGADMFPLAPSAIACDFANSVTARWHQS
jgi:hypothetical protein